MEDSRQQTADSRTQTVHSRQQTADINSRPQTVDSRQQTADSRQQTLTADSRQQTADSRQQTADSKKNLTVPRVYIPIHPHNARSISQLIPVVLVCRSDPPDSGVRAEAKLFLREASEW
jgi:exonuclease VII large subunit